MEYSCKANITKAIQLSNGLFMKAIKPYLEEKLSEDMRLDGTRGEVCI